MANEVLIQLARIEANTDALLLHQTRIDSTIVSQDARIRTVERKQSWILGIGAGAVTLASYVAGLLHLGGTS